MKQLLPFAAALAASAAALAQPSGATASAAAAPAAKPTVLSVVLAAEPTSRKGTHLVVRHQLEATLAKVAGQAAAVTTSDDLTEVMRATRSQGYDVFVAPPQVAASALLRGYDLVGSTDAAESYVLVGRASLGSAAALKGARIYLPQQDSIYTYMARGMLNAHGLSFSDLKHIEYARYPEAGLTAVLLGRADATVVRRGEWAGWSAANAGVARELAASGAVPGGYSVVVRSDLPAEVRGRVARWFAGGAVDAVGLKPAALRAELNDYKTVAQLGFFTPTTLPGAKVVKADEVQRLAAAGAVLVDTRSEKEYLAKRMPGAVFVPYHEKSLKDVAFDARQDDFAELARLDKARPTVFACNGAECWKSYKASRTALQRGFGQVYWFRGGLPEWEAAGLPVAKGAPAP